MGEQTALTEDTFHIDAYAFYEAIVNSTDDYIYIVDMATDVSLVSDNMCRDFDLPGRTVNGLVPLWGNLIHKKDQKRYYESIDAMLQGYTDQHNVEYQIRNRKNEYIWVVCRGLLKRDENGNPTMFAGVVTPIDSKGKIDRTTGLFTQEECKRRVEMLLNQEESSGGVLLLGIDDFKLINNLKHHIFGDSVLRQIFQDIQQLLPHQAEIFRFDGDEVAILYAGATVEDLKELYQSIHLYANREHEIDGISYFCTLSGGIVMLGQDADNYLDLIKYAMSALDASKRKGKNTYTVFTPDLLQAEMRAMEIIHKLQHSVINDMEGFSLVYQPVVSSDQSHLKGAEALLRWSSDSFDNIGPAEFVPLLESSGCIISVGKWVLDESFKVCKEWIQYCPEFIMNINVSYLQIIEKDFVKFIENLLEKYRLDGRHIVLELTESYFVTDMIALKEAFEKLRDLNIHIAMDDFGTGYSSLGMLSQSPADIVKIDRVFITLINDQDHTFNRSFIKAVIQLCHSVGISVCVEGVEYKDEFKTVRRLNADSIQGYYVSRPISREQFEEKYWAEKNIV